MIKKYKLFGKKKYIFPIYMTLKEIKKTFFIKNNLIEKKIYIFGRKYIIKYTKKQMANFRKDVVSYKNGKPVSIKKQEKINIKDFKSLTVLWLWYIIPAWLNKNKIYYDKIIRE